MGHCVYRTGGEREGLLTYQPTGTDQWCGSIYSSRASSLCSIRSASRISSCLLASPQTMLYCVLSLFVIVHRIVSVVHKYTSFIGGYFYALMRLWAPVNCK